MNGQHEGQTHLIASAVLVQQSQLRALASTRPWQTEAWEHYDQVGELKSGVRWLAKAVSRCRLFVGEITDDGQGDPVPTDNDLAAAPLEELFGGANGQAAMLQRLVAQLSVPGDSYVIGMDLPSAGSGPQRRWIVASTDEFQRGTGDRVQVRMPDTGEPVELDVTQSTVIRLWQPHDRYAWEADSAVRSLLTTLREIRAADAHITASLDSRLAGAGLLIMPESASFPAPQESEGPSPIHADPAMAALIDAMVTPLSNRDSAAAVVPLLIRVPDEAAGKTQHLSFSTPLDAKVLDLRAAAISRLAIGMDLPPEELLGMGSSTTNHWTAWEIDESAVKMHISPVTAVICAGLTEQYLRPAHAATGVPSPEKYVVWFDDSPLVVRPNLGPEAVTLYGQGLVGGQAVRSENGFSEDDAPQPEEAKTMLLRQLLLAAPQLADQIMPLLGVTEWEAAPPPATDGGQGQPGDADMPSGADAPRGELPLAPGTNPPASNPPGSSPPSSNPPSSSPPANEQVAQAWRLAAVELATLRALEIAGKRLLSAAGRSWRGRVDVPAWDIHTVVPTHHTDVERLLDGAYTVLDVVVPPDATCTRRAVDDYVRALLQAGQRHERRYLVAALARAGCALADLEAVRAA